MKIISHRGNLNGSDPKTENNPNQIDKVLTIGYDVEIDLHLHNDNLYLGHDYPIYQIDKDWLLNRKEKLWVHLKTLELANFSFLKHLNYFWHENDKFTLTSKGIPWCYPGVFLNDGVTVVLDGISYNKNIFGICVDYIKVTK